MITIKCAHDPGHVNGSSDLSETMSAEDRLRLVRRLTERAWALAGKPIPDVPRSRWPVRITRVE
jgi:hypothetical protein